MWWRHLKSILILPLNVMILIPAILVWLFDYPNIPSSDQLLQLAGIGFMAIGLPWGIYTFITYIKHAAGTAAPWDPSTQLVIVGPYRLVRNPMILGVCLVLFGEALVFQSTAIFIYFLIFWIGNTFYFKYSEEPGLRKRFGKEYDEYAKKVNRWLPRIPID
jgi:protein-S-isoprenylcysteine O-methyltransferase Ste14